MENTDTDRVKSPEAPPDFAAALSAMLEGQIPSIPASKEAYLEHVFRTSILPRLRAANVTDRHTVKIAMTTEQKAVFSLVLQLVRKPGAILVLVGPRGTGKTTIAAQLIRKWLWEDYQSAFDQADGKREGVLFRICRYWKLSKLISKLKSLYADFGSIDGEQATSCKELCSTVDLLVIDELAEALTEPKFKDPILTDLLDIRYSRNLPTILISNETMDSFRKGTNDSVKSRIKECGAVIPCDWTSFR